MYLLYFLFLVELRFTWNRVINSENAYYSYNCLEMSHSIDRCGTELNQIARYQKKPKEHTNKWPHHVKAVRGNHHSNRSVLLRLKHWRPTAGWRQFFSADAGIFGAKVFFGREKTSRLHWTIYKTNRPQESSLMTPKLSLIIVTLTLKTALT